MRNQQNKLTEDTADRQAARQEAALNRGSYTVGTADGSTKIGTFDVLKPDGTFDKAQYDALQQALKENPQAVRQTSEQWSNNKARLMSEQFAGRLLIAQQKAAGSVQDLDPDTLALAAADVQAQPEHMRNYASFGQAGQGRRDQINGAIAQNLKAMHLNPSDLTGWRAEVKANGTAIGKLVPQLQQISVNEDLARNNGDRIMSLVDKVNTSQFSSINSLLQGVKKGTGGADAAELSSVLVTFQTEAARIVAGSPNQTGVLSDAARHELQQVVDGTLAPGALKRVIQRLYTEFDVKRAAIRDAISSSAGVMGNTQTLQGIPGLQSTGVGAAAGAANAPSTIPKGVTFTVSH
jgi:hypothetical protein